MGKDEDQVQTQCGTCQLAADREESYTVFISEDWRSSFMQYLTEGILPQRHSEKYKFKRLATRYFLHNVVLFKKGYDGDPLRIISDNDTPFVNSDVRRMLEFYQVKHHRSSPYYPQGNGQAEATNKTLIKIISKMSQENTGGWAMQLSDALWAYKKSPKLATGFSPLSLVYGTEVVSPTKIMTLSLRVMQMREKEKEGEVFVAERFKNLEELDEKREEAQERSRRYRQKMTEAYGRMTKERVFAEGQLMLKVADYVRRGLAGPSKFTPKWEGPL
ncbi:uncharacterized protein LOC126704905 [Quercus robur]|uniref:uncharacterized protein LOC126704905 n=1 Tax=Quercus robur TaxID=38942 RepID=UPI0021631B7E|nr:uncharacterized protein LOC126704905 [Quercus robur]